MAKVVYNTDFGGFSLSNEAIALGRELSKNRQWGKNPWYANIPRHDHTLVAIVETLGGDKASGSHARLAIREVPDGARYRIDEYDGAEHVILQGEDNWEVAS